MTWRSSARQDFGPGVLVVLNTKDQTFTIMPDIQSEALKVCQKQQQQLQDLFAKDEDNSCCQSTLIILLTNYGQNRCKCDLPMGWATGGFLFSQELQRELKQRTEDATKFQRQAAESLSQRWGYCRNSVFAWGLSQSLFVCLFVGCSFVLLCMVVGTVPSSFVTSRRINIPRFCCSHGLCTIQRTVIS